MLRFKPSRGLLRSSRTEARDPVTIAELQSLIAHGELEALANGFGVLGTEESSHTRAV